MKTNSVCSEKIFQEIIDQINREMLFYQNLHKNFQNQNGKTIFPVALRNKILTGYSKQVSYVQRGDKI